MDIGKLITTGKMNRVVTFAVEGDEFTFSLMTPDAEQMAISLNTDNVLNILPSYIVKVENKPKNEVVDTTEVEGRAWLREVLGKFQGAFVTQLFNACMEMATKQREMVENFTKVS